MASTDLSGSESSGASSSGGLSSLIYDRKFRAWFFQIALLLAVFGFFFWIIQNTITNIAALDKKTGFDFLNSTSGFQILTTPGTWAMDFTIGESTYLDVFFVGVINTLVVAIVGIIAATILGFILGIFRLSSNVVLRGFATAYVELLRNLPLLLQMFFIYTALLTFVPNARGQIELIGGFSINITGLYGPFPVAGDGFWMTFLAFTLGVAAWWGIGTWARARQAATGQQFPVFWAGLGVLTVLTGVVFLATGMPLTWEIPVFSTEGPVFRRGFQSDPETDQIIGMVAKPEMIAIWAALTLYTAAFIAEIVRAGILAVNKGQTEAAYALGLRPQPTLNLVVIPQALRVIIPPLTSQFLNLTKNSSLAVAIAYPDVVSVFAGTALNQVGQEIEMIFMMMMVYLFFSITISIIMNWYNKRISLVER